VRVTTSHSFFKSFTSVALFLPKLSAACTLPVLHVVYKLGTGDKALKNRERTKKMTSRETAEGMIRDFLGILAHRTLLFLL
jgi:hypothetical protein